MAKNKFLLKFLVNIIEESLKHLLLWVGVRRRPSSIKIFFSRTTVLLHVYSVCRVRRHGIVNVMTSFPKVGNFWVKSVELMYFLKFFLLYWAGGMVQTNEAYANDDKGRIYQNCNFMTR